MTQLDLLFILTLLINMCLISKEIKEVKSVFKSTGRLLVLWKFMVERRAQL